MCAEERGRRYLDFYVCRGEGKRVFRGPIMCSKQTTCDEGHRFIDQEYQNRSSTASVRIHGHIFVCFSKIFLVLQTAAIIKFMHLLLTLINELLTATEASSETAIGWN